MRFAPSPTGALHVGNVRTALFNWLWARQRQGSFILRIEDTDLERSRAEYEQQIYEDLKWFGLDWDEGPDVGGEHGPYRQSQRLDLYKDAAHRLLQEGKAYHCFCTPDELEAERQLSVVSGQLSVGKDEDEERRTTDNGQQTTDQEEQRTTDNGQRTRYVYSGRCRKLSPDEVQQRLSTGLPFTIRFIVPSGQVTWDDMVRGAVTWDAELLGDFVIIKSDGWPVYNFAVVVDDIQMNITHVIRGDGHLPNTPRQILIYEALGARPPRFGHLSTILGPDGTKLSKRHGATSILEFREQGYLPEALFNFLALLGWQPEGETELMARGELIEQFSMNRVGKAPAMFDVEKLNWMNRHYLKHAPRERLVELIVPYLRRQGRLKESAPDELTTRWLTLVLDTAVTYLDYLSQIVRETDVIFEYDLEGEAHQDEVREVLADPASIEVIRALQDELAPLPHVTLDAFQAATTAVKRRTGRQGRALFHPIRVALTGRASGPELVKLVPIYELGSQLDLPQPVLSCRQRLRLFLERARKSEGSETRGQTDP